MTSTLIVAGSHIDITVEDEKNSIPQADLIAWVKMAAESVAGYYGRYPVPHLTLRVTPFSGHGVRHGMTWGMHGGLIKIGLGNETTSAELMNDWMLTHEMIHLAFPSVADDHHWIEEGISTYVEPIARIRISNMKEEQMWADLIRDMPKGQPRDGDEGLDNTHTWGRTYWGGALFCFDADVEIRRQTQNKKGLQDALRGILDAGGNITNDWDLAEAFKIGDKATGVTVLTDLYNKMKDHPMPVDLAEKWKFLGIEWDGATVHLHDDAPGASIRRAITGADAQSHAAASIQPIAVLAGRKIGS
ncbi:MAG: hypothetical protein ABLT11_01390 [Candidatus Acidiferrum sp.]